MVKLAQIKNLFNVGMALTGVLGSTLLSAEPAGRSIPIYNAQSLKKACTDGLAEAKQLVAKLEHTPLRAAIPTSYLGSWDALRIVLEDVENISDLVTNVFPDEASRTSADECLTQTNRFDTELLQDKAIYLRMRSVKTSTPPAAKLKKDILDDFQDTGVSLPIAKQNRMKEILDRLEAIRQEFGRDIRNNKTQLAFNSDEVEGLSADYLKRAKRDELGRYLLGFDYPDYEPFMENASREDARQRFYVAFNNRGTPRNLELLAEAMSLRKEMAGLFGLPSYAHYATRRRMVRNPETVNKFLTDVYAAVFEAEVKEIDELTDLKAATLGKSRKEVKLNRWDLAFFQEKLKKTRYRIDQEVLRQYFPTEASVKWVLAISSELYAVRFVPAKVPVWSDDVQYFDVVHAKSGRFISGVYLDLYPRPGKYTHAAAFPVRSSSRLAKRTPISALVTNLNKVGLDHDELETLVHEFGHVLHGVLSNTDYASQGGTSVERDFVEAPSQMYEEWARRKESLSLLKQYCSTECPTIDDDLIARLSAARLYGSGMRYARQHLYATYDMTTSGERVDDPQAVWDRMESQTPLGHVPGTQFPGTFEHIISGYTAGYYGYMWSEVLALDMLSKFDDNLMNPEVGHHFRETVLNQGSQQPAAQMVRKFLGRDPSNEAFYAEITGKRSTASKQTGSLVKPTS